MNQRKVLLGELRLHLHLAALRKPEQWAGTRSDDLSDLDVASEHEARDRSYDIQAADLRASCSKLGLGDPNLGVGRIARRFLGIDFRLGNEAAALQGDCALIIRLGQRCIGARQRSAWRHS